RQLAGGERDRVGFAVFAGDGLVGRVKHGERAPGAGGGEPGDLEAERQRGAGAVDDLHHHVAARGVAHDGGGEAGGQGAAGGGLDAVFEPVVPGVFTEEALHLVVDTRIHRGVGEVDEVGAPVGVAPFGEQRGVGGEGDDVAVAFERGQIG